MDALRFSGVVKRKRYPTEEEKQKARENPELEIEIKVFKTAIYLENKELETYEHHNEFESVEVSDLICKVRKKLNQKEEIVLDGLLNEKTQDEIALILGQSSSNVSHLKKELFRKFRSNLR